MALNNKWTLLVVIALVSGCSKEGGYPPPNAAQAASVKDATLANLKIDAWGPQGTKAGATFNAQSDGTAAIWMKVNQSLEGSESTIMMDGMALHSAISGSQITAGVPASFYARAGSRELHVVEKKGANSVQSNSVNFVVQ
ncbi:MAG TPA: hypothetical protein VGC19_05835 [Rhodanobacter sp.]